MGRITDMRKIKLIFNPMSDRGRSGQKASDLRAIVEEYGGADWVGTEYPMHAGELAARAGLDGYDTVAAMGGDGTVHEVVNGLMRVAPPQTWPHPHRLRQRFCFWRGRVARSE